MCVRACVYLCVLMWMCVFGYSSLEEGVQRGRVEALRVNLYECPGHHGKFRFNGAGPFNDMFWITLMFLFGSKTLLFLERILF